MRWNEEVKNGYVIGNSSISADVSKKGRLFSKIVYNPPYFNYDRKSLINAGEARLEFNIEGKKFFDDELNWNVEENVYPKYIANTDITKDVAIRVHSLSPISINNSFDMFLPSIINFFEIENKSDVEKSMLIKLSWKTTNEFMLDSFNNQLVLEKENKIAIAHRGDAYIAAKNADEISPVDLNEEDGVISLKIKIIISKNQKKSISIALGYIEIRSLAYTKLKSMKEAVLYTMQDFKYFQNELNKFISAIPITGDEKIDLYHRWYLQAGILLTKGASTGEITTMGYTELNQRDSYYTSYIHLVFWKDLEKSIIQSTIRWQRLDGKIPTCIMPVIEREYDIDINEYFMLRVARYYQYHMDKSFLEDCWQSYVKSLEYLISRDTDKDGIPEQVEPSVSQDCYFADWKDVSGVIGRKLSPHFCLLWLAVLKQTIKLADILCDNNIKELCEKLYELAYENINKSYEDGGLWKVDHYAEQWYDNRDENTILADQTVGAMFGVIESDKLESIYKALGKNETELGIPETYPYRNNFGYEGGDYHNGGIWPFLVAYDAYGRYLNGYCEDAERLLKKCGYFDLEKPGNWLPHEYYTSNNLGGENRGPEIQGWCAAYFATIYFGAFGVKRINEETFEVNINFKNRDFCTQIWLPKPFEKITIRRVDGKVCSSDPQKGKVIIKNN